MINKVILVGNVGIDPEVRALEGGAKVARIRLATTERSYNRDTRETKEYTEWHTVVLWRGLADVVDRFVRKGSQLYIEGSLRTREWTDRDNQKRYTTEIVANEMKLLGRRGDAPAGDSYGQQGGYSSPAQGGYGSTPSTPGGYNSGYGQQGGYSQPAQGGYSTPSAAASAPVPSVPDDVDDLPF